jgi:hypothetical protein
MLRRRELVRAARSGRDERGHFVNGCARGPGNPVARRMHENRRLIDENTSQEDKIAVWRAIVDGAKGGDAACLKLFADYIWGRAPVKVELDSPAEKPRDIPLHEALTALGYTKITPAIGVAVTPALQGPPASWEEPPDGPAAHRPLRLPPGHPPPPAVPSRRSAR